MNKTTIGLGLVACTLIVGSTECLVVAAQQGEMQQPLTTNQTTDYTPLLAAVKPFTEFENEAYTNQFKISTNQIARITNNAGHYSDRVLANAIDGDPTTYWETNKANSTTWKNEVEVTFTEAVTINRLVFGARPDKKGFATKFEVYTSATADGDTFELAASGSHQAVNGLISAEFAPTHAQRVKVKFIESTQNWATLSELAFYTEDVVDQAMQQLFTDQTYRVVNPAYANETALARLEVAAQSHPLAAHYLPRIADARTLINHTPIESVEAQTKPFLDFDREAYNDTFQIPSSALAAITNNAGYYSHRVLANAIDGDPTTYWETNKANSTTWKNEVIVDFNEPQTFNRLVFGARPDKKGFATKFEVYASPTADGETFELLATGSHAAVSGLVEATFPTTTMKRVKLKFIESTQNWATLNELAFYKEDIISQTIYDLFVDQTYSELKPMYADRAILEQLEVALPTHPNQAELAPLLAIAFQIIDGTLSQQNVILTANQDGDMNAHAKNTLAMSMAGQNFQATGVYGLPNEKVIVYVDVEPGTKNLPQIAFSQNHGSWRGYAKTYKLQPGRNEIIVPTFDLTSDIYIRKPSPGGAAYIVNPYTPEQQGRAPKIRIEGAHEFPLYREGDDEAAFIETLMAYHERLRIAQENDDQSVLNLMEIEGERILISTLASAAYDVYVTEARLPSQTIQHWNETFNELLAFNGLDGSSPAHDAKNLKEHVRVMQPHGALYAYTTHVGIQTGTAAAVLREGALNGWGLAHETGHRFDNKFRSWGEVTNNMEAMYASHLTGDINDRVKYEQVYQKTAQMTQTNRFAEGGYFTTLGAFWQLQIVNDNYWPELNRLYRERRPSLPSEQVKNDLLVQYSSEVLGFDVTEHFRRHGLVVSETMATELAQTYPAGPKTWYLNTNAWQYDGTGLAESDKASITSIDQTGTVTIATTIDQADLLGFEVLRDGEVIGFTRTHSFTDSNYQNDRNYDYSLIPYGADFEAGVESARYQSYTPSLATTMDAIYLPLYAEFDPLAYVVAKNYQGELIPEQIVVDSNVKLDEKGEYAITYSLTDHGITVEQTIPVHVLAKATPLSELDWETATQSYKAPRKDENLNGKGLSLTSATGDAIPYQKGLGTHANADITYDLSAGEYTRFESAIGIDHDMVTRNGSVIFTVYVDGEKRYESGVMRAGIPQKQLSVDVTGAQTLQLVVSDAGDGNAADHATFGNPILLTASEKPVIAGIDATTFVPFRTDFDLVTGLQATDIEDGDLTSQVSVDAGAFDMQVPGVYPITYTVSDRDGNQTHFERTVIVYSNQTYASDVAWESATSGWKTVNKDSAVSTTKPIQLQVNGSNQLFAKGLGAAANAEIVYDLTASDAEYFTSYVGTDKNFEDTRTSIQFSVLADGVEVYRSAQMGQNSPAEFIQIPVTGVKELRLIADNVDGNGIGDFASWGDAQFLTTNSKPQVTVAKDAVFEVGATIDEATVIGAYAAIDVEDGDLSAHVQVTGLENFTTAKPGTYPLQYTVTDADGNTTTQTRTVAVVDLADYTYLTDYEWQSAIQSYSSTQKDQHYSGSTLRLTGANQESIPYERGLGTHANAEIIYDLTQTDAAIFSTYVGIDRTMYNSSAASVIFEVYVDGEKVAATDVMRAKDPQQYIQVPILGAKELKLIVNNAGNGNGSDHGTFGDTKLHYVNTERADLTALTTLITEIETIDLTTFTAESVAVLQTALEAARELIARGNVMQAEADDMYATLANARDQLETINQVIPIPDAALKQGIIKTLGLTTDEVTRKDLARLETLNLEGEYVEKLDGLEYATNLVSLNLNFNAVSDLRPLANLPKLTDLHVQESFLELGNADYEAGKFIIEPYAVFDRDGTQLEPSAVILTSGNETVTVPFEQVYQNGEIQIDAKLLAGERVKRIEVMYASPRTDFSVYTMVWLELPTSIDANPEVTIPDPHLQAAIRESVSQPQLPLRARDLAKLTTLNLEGSSVQDLTGLEYAVELEQLNVNYSEVHNLQPLQLLPKLTSLQAEENFQDLGDATFAGQTFTIPVSPVLDRNGQLLEPSEVVLSARNEMITLPFGDVYKDGIITIDASLLGTKKVETVEVMYASTETNFSFFTFHWLKQK